MDRFNPYSHPDRFVFEAEMHKTRAEEIDKFFHALGVWVIDHEHALVQRLSHLSHSLRHHEPARHH
jgi:hypothetical protein